MPAEVKHDIHAPFPGWLSIVFASVWTVWLLVITVMLLQQNDQKQRVCGLADNLELYYVGLERVVEKRMNEGDAALLVQIRKINHAIDDLDC